MRHHGGMPSSQKFVRPSRVTIPQHGHPLVRLLYRLMRDHGVTHSELEFRSGILRQTFKAWRNEKVPSLQAIEATLGAFGYRLLPCGPLDDLPGDVREQLEEVGQHFVSDDEALAAAIHLATSQPRATAAGGPRYLSRSAPYWREARA